MKAVLIVMVDALGMISWMITLLWYFGGHSIELTLRELLPFIIPAIFPLCMAFYMIYGKWNATYYFLQTLLFTYSLIGIAWAVIITFNLFN